MKVLLLVAGMNSPSNCETLGDSFAKGIEESGGSMEKVCIRDLSIAHFTMDCYRPDFPHEADVCRVKDLLFSCDGFAIATPIWNFSVPAHLKNLIDVLGAFGLDEATRSKGTLKGKPFFLLFTGGAPESAWIGLMKKTTSHLAQSLQYFGGSFIGLCFEGRCMRGPGKFGLVLNERPASLATARAKGVEFAKIVSVFAKTGKAPLQHRIRANVMQWGERMLKKFT